jgi:hypothetical protein
VERVAVATVGLLQSYFQQNGKAGQKQKITEQDEVNEDSLTT